MHPVTDRLGIAWAGGARLTSPARRLLPSPLGLALLGGILLVAFFKLMDWTAELLWFRALGYEVSGGSFSPRSRCSRSALFLCSSMCCSISWF